MRCRPLPAPFPSAPAQTFTTLAAGYAAAVDGDTLLIFDGIYAGGLTVNKLLTFQAVNIGGAIVDGGGSGVGFTVGRDSTYIGLTVRNADSAYFQRDNHAHGVIMRSVIEDVINGVEINDTGGTAGSFDVFQSTFNSFGTAVYINDGGTINITNSILANGGTAYSRPTFLPSTRITTCCSTSESWPSLARAATLARSARIQRRSSAIRCS